MAQILPMMEEDWEGGPLTLALFGISTIPSHDFGESSEVKGFLSKTSSTDNKSWTTVKRLRDPLDHCEFLAGILLNQLEYLKTDSNMCVFGKLEMRFGRPSCGKSFGAALW